MESERRRKRGEGRRERGVGRLKAKGRGRKIGREARGDRKCEK